MSNFEGFLLIVNTLAPFVVHILPTYVLLVETQTRHILTSVSQLHHALKMLAAWLSHFAVRRSGVVI